MNETNRKKIEELMVACIGCKRCVKVCPSFANGGCDPYYVMHGWDGKVQSCIGCGKCSEVCPATDPKVVMIHMKAEALGLSVPDSFSKCGCVFPLADPSWSEGLPEIPDGNDEFLMPGCVVNGKAPYLKYAAKKAFSALGVGMKELPGNTCCTYPIVLRSMTDMERDSVKYRLRQKAHGKEMVTLCGGCCIELAKSAIHAPHISTVLVRYLSEIRALPGVHLKVAMEPGCACERYIKDFEAVVRATGAEPIGNEYGCCGKGVPEVSAKLMAQRQAEARGADVIVAGCPNCVIAYDSVPDGIPVIHIAELVALAAGDSETQRFHKLKIDPARIKN